MKSLVTGGAGFIGSHLCDLLLEKGHEVVVLDDLSNGDKNNVPEGCTFVEGSITNEKLVEEVSKGCDVIFHEAAIADIQVSLKNPKLVNEVNVGGTINVLEAARKNDVGRVIFASSSSIYGEATPPIKETATPNPKTPYAVTKLLGEHYLRVYSELYGMTNVALRYFNVYGPRQKVGPVVSSFIEAAKKGEPLVIFGNGNQNRDFVYVGDVVEANLLSLNLKSGSTTLNVAAGKKLSVLDVAKKIKYFLSDAELSFASPRVSDVKTSVADISLAEKLISWSPKTKLDDGIRITISSY